MGHPRRALVALVSLVACVACGSTTLAGAIQTPNPSVAPSAAATPSVSASPTAAPPPDYGPPPAGVDLFYLQWPASPTWLIGFDWSGTPRATVHLREVDGQTDPYGSGIAVAPNGSAFATPVMTFDRLGQLIYKASAPASKGSLITQFSENGQLMCGVEEQTSGIDSNGNGTTDFYLVRRPLTGPGVRVAKFLHLDAIPGDMGYTAASCSQWLDRVLLVRTVCCGIQGALVLRLSDGARIGTWTRDAGQPVFSPDGQLVADPTWTPAGRTMSTEVKLVVGGTVLARYGPDVAFQAFSGDNRLAVVVNAGRTEVIEVATRRVVWRDSLVRALARVVARPFSGDVALVFGDPSRAQPMNVVLVRANGASAALAGQWLVPMGWS